VSAYGGVLALRAPRANPVFRTDEKHIRSENRVMDKNNSDLGLLLTKIADCARMRFSSARNRRSARTGRRPRKLEHHSLKYRQTSADVVARPLRAPRANHVFRTDANASARKTRLWTKAITEGCDFL